MPLDIILNAVLIVYGVQISMLAFAYIVLLYFKETAGDRLEVISQRMDIPTATFRSRTWFGFGLRLLLVIGYWAAVVRSL